MNHAVSEIVRYCREENTFGALLLCGEWGAGKTYLLEHPVRDALGEDFLLLRLSLFGAASVEHVRESVQREVWRAEARLQPGQELPDRDLCVPEPELAGKRLILAFDDLERTRLSQMEILGCINEYCEGLHIKTIVIANEEKLESLNGRRTDGHREEGEEYLLYTQMKEKLITRTVRLTPKLAQITASVVAQYRSSTPGYREFLERCEPALISLMKDCELKNIRSLRCGLQDFERLYVLCREEELPEEILQRYLISFVLFTMLAKGNRISRSPLYGYGLNRLEQKYPGHYREAYMPDVLKDSVLTGRWEEARIRGELHRQRELAAGRARPEQQLRCLSLMELDDATVRQGWKSYLALAYEGALSPEEYLHLLEQLALARKYHYTWPLRPDGKRLSRGAQISLDRLCRSGEAPMPLTSQPEEALPAHCSAGERELYERILTFYEKKQYLSGLHREELLNSLRRRDPAALHRCCRRGADALDREMVRELLAWYETLPTNQERIRFADAIRQLLAACGRRESYDPQTTAQSLRELRESLERLRMASAGEPLRQIAVRYFIEQTEAAGLLPPAQ